MFNTTRQQKTKTDLKNFAKIHNYTDEDLTSAFLDLYNVVASSDGTTPTEPEEMRALHAFIKFCIDNTQNPEELLGQSTWFQILMKILTPTTIDNLATDNLPLSSLIKDFFKTWSDVVQAASKTPVGKAKKVVDGVEVPRYIYDLWRAVSPGSKFLFKLLIGIGGAYAFEPEYRAAGGLLYKPPGDSSGSTGGRPPPLELKIFGRSVLDLSILLSPKNPPTPMDSPPELPGCPNTPTDQMIPAPPHLSLANSNSASSSSIDGAASAGAGAGAGAGADGSAGSAGSGSGAAGSAAGSAAGDGIPFNANDVKAYMDMAIYLAEIAGRMATRYSELKQDGIYISFHELLKLGISEGGPKGLITGLSMSVMDTTGINELFKATGKFISQTTSPVLDWTIIPRFTVPIISFTVPNFVPLIGSRATPNSITIGGPFPTGKIIGGTVDVMLKSFILVSLGRIVANGVAILSAAGYLPPQEIMAGAQLSVITASGIAWIGQQLSLIDSQNTLIPSVIGVSYSYYMFPTQTTYYSSSHDSYIDNAIALTENTLALAICLNGVRRINFVGAKKVILCETVIIGGSYAIKTVAEKISHDLTSMVNSIQTAFCKHTGSVCKKTDSIKSMLSKTITDTIERISEITNLFAEQFGVKSTLPTASEEDKEEEQVDLITITPITPAGETNVVDGDQEEL